MRTKFPCSRRAITVAIIAGMAFQASAQDEPVEEIVVTGSYFRGSPLDAPSPVQVIDRSSIEAQGAAVIWDVIKNLEVNSGSITNPGSDNGQVEGTANVNLRNLGENSTLTLINGKRMVPAAAVTQSGGEFVDLNSIPLVMTDRVEVLTDGGSALYGADAVAGVVNIIMRTEFEGLEIYGDVQGVQAADNAYDATVSAIWGTSFNDGATNLVLSAERFERDPVAVKDGNFFGPNSEFLGTVSDAGTLVNSPAFGSQFNSAQWLNNEIYAQNVAEGGQASNYIYTDPGCYTTTLPDGSTPQIGRLREERGEKSGACRADQSDYTFITNTTERDAFAGSFSHAFNDTTEFYSFFSHSDSETTRSDSGYNQSRGPTVFLAPPGAYARSAAFGGNSIGQTAEIGFFAPEAGLTRPTLADMPNMPLATSNGGPNVMMYQGVRDGIDRLGATNNITKTSTVNVQAGLKGEFEAFDRVLDYDVSYSWGGSSLEQQYKTFNRDRSELAANGLGGPNCTPNGRSDFDFVGAPGPFGGAVPQIWDFYAPGLVQTFFPGFVFTTRENLSYALTSNNQGQGDCMFYNPYLSQLSDPNLANSRELMDWMNVTVDRVDKRNKLAVFDARVSGDLMEMKGGTAQFALGGQYRERNTKEEASELHYPGLQNRILGYDENGTPNEFHRVSNNFECAMCAFNYNDTRTTKAVFMELSLPFIENVETQIALRYEDYGGNIGSEVSPKIAMSWRPMESLLIRGSFSQSFRAPNIAIVETGLQSSGYTFRDPISNQAVRAGLLPAIDANAEAEGTYTLGGPAPYVGNEYADTYSLGFQWTPDGALDGLSVGADLWRFEVSDRVLPEPPIRAIQPEIAAFNEAAKDESNYIFNDSIPADSPQPYTSCSPSAVAAEFGVDSDERLNCVVDPRTYVVPGIQRAFGSTTANLITTTLSAVNAGTITADGADVQLGYNWSNDMGLFSARVNFTHVRQYTLANVPGLERGLLDTYVYDAAGTTGDGNIVRSLPDNKGTLTMSWQRDSHGLTLINRHIGSYRDLAYQTAYEAGSDFTRSLLDEKIDSYNTWDFQYRYSKDWGGRIGSTNFSLGVLDMFNEDIPYREVGGRDYDTVVFDGRGRRIYARVLWQIQ